jgi:hypothetical protein
MLYLGTGGKNIDTQTWAIIANVNKKAATETNPP